MVAHGYDHYEFCKIVKKSGVPLARIPDFLTSLDAHNHLDVTIWSPEVIDGEVVLGCVVPDGKINIVVNGGHAYAVVRKAFLPVIQRIRKTWAPTDCHCLEDNRKNSELVHFLTTHAPSKTEVLRAQNVYIPGLGVTIDNHTTVPNTRYFLNRATINNIRKLNPAFKQRLRTEGYCSESRIEEKNGGPALVG